MVYSVVIAAKNAEKTILSSISSVLNQSLPPLEIIVIDDCSSDRTVEMVSGISRVVVLRGEGLGSGPARNLGVRNAKSEIIAFLDADDVWHQRKMEIQLERFFSAPERVIGSYARYLVRGDNNRVVGSSRPIESFQISNTLLSEGEELPALLSTWVLSRELFEKYGFFNSNFVTAQDFEFAVRLSRAGILYEVIPEFLVDYFISEESESSARYVDQYLSAEYVRQHNPTGPAADLDVWKHSLKPYQHEVRRARAGSFMRQGLSFLESKPLKAYLYFGISALLDLKNFIKKLRLQSRRIN